MTKEDYKRLAWDFTHCQNADCQVREDCVRYQAFRLLPYREYSQYRCLTPSLLSTSGSCPEFVADRKEVYAWGLSRIYDDVKSQDKGDLRLRLFKHFGRSGYYHFTSKRRALKPEEQSFIRAVFEEAGYDGRSIEFDEYQEEYPFLMVVHQRSKKSKS